ncbi:MAG: hypothetical protein RR728_03360 [Oscillospiraceae bacterium]
MNMMVHMGVAVGALLLGSLFFSVAFKKNIEECIAPAIFAIVTVLYFFYCADKLYLGYKFTLILLAVGGIFSLWRVIKDKEIKGAAGRVFTQGLAVFLVFCVGIYMITKGNVVQNWDDLRLWGAVPKVMFYDGSLQLGKGAIIYPTMQSYYPGMQLFAFFITKTMGRFYDGGIYLAYGIFAMGMLVGVFSRSKKKINPLTPLIALVLLWLPMTFYNNMLDAAVFYQSLYIDPILAIMCGYVFYLVARNVNRDLFSQIRFCLALGMMIQLKDSALLFAVAAILCAAFMQGHRVQKQGDALLKAQQTKSLALWIVATSAAVVAVIVPWKIQMARFGVNTHIGLKTPMGEKTPDIISKFIKTLFTASLVQQKEDGGVLKYCTYFAVMAVFILVGAIIYKCIDKKKRRSFLVAAIGIFLCNIGFVAGLCYMYMGLGWEEFASYPRYTGTVVLAILAFFVLYIGGEMLSKSINVKKLALPGIILIALFFLPVNPIPQKYSPWIEDEYLWQATKANAERIAAGVDKTKAQGNRTKINFVMKQENGYSILHHTIYYALLSDDIEIRFNSLVEGIMPFYTRSKEEQAQYNKEWLLSADYLYIFDYDDKFIWNFGEFFKSGMEQLTGSSMYYIQELAQGDISLVKVEYQEPSEL